MEPGIRVSVESCSAEGAPGRWRVTWRVQNDSPSPLLVHDAWIPHGRFRGDGHVALALTIEHGRSSHIALSVTADEAPGTVVENAFLILRAEQWRIFARMRVEFDAERRPTPIVEVISAQSLQ